MSEQQTARLIAVKGPLGVKQVIISTDFPVLDAAGDSHIIPHKGLYDIGLATPASSLSPKIVAFLAAHAND